MVRRDDIFDEELRRALAAPGHRADGPDDEELLDAIEAELAGRPGLFVGDCDHCASVVGAVAEAVAGWERGALDSVREAAGKFVDVVFRVTGDALSFLSGSVVPVAVASPVAVRSGQSAPVALQEFDVPLEAGHLHVMLERLPSGGCQLEMEAADGARGRTLRAVLRRGDKLLESAPFEKDRLRFSGLGTGAYRVEILEGPQVQASLRIRLLGSDE